jgi:hypothetical protein
VQFKILSAPKELAPVGQTLAGPQAPPPIPGTTLYFAAIEGKQTGPFDLKTLQVQALAGHVTQTALVWTQGLNQWTPAEQVPALSGLFAAAPPPIPPA